MGKIVHQSVDKDMVEYAKTTPQLSQISKDVTDLKNGTAGSISLLTKLKNDILQTNNRKITKWEYPSWWNWKDAPIRIFTDGTNFFTPFDVSVFKNTGGKNIYVDPVNGVDTNNGLTTSTQVKTVQKAYDLALDGDTIVCKAGIYKRGNILSAGTRVGKNINIVSDGTGKVRWYAGDDHTYTKTAGYTHIYQTARTNVKDVIDLQLQPSFNETIRLKKVNDLATCDSMEGSWFNDGTNTYIHMIGNVIPSDVNVVILLDTGNSLVTVEPSTKNVSLYMEGIEMYGGQANINIRNTATYLLPNLYLKNCVMRHAFSLNALHVLGAQYVFSQDCEASYAPLDGFNYHIQNGTKVKSIEVNCVGRGNGDNSLTTDTNNGSTTHDGNNAIRINCTYYENMGTNVADVHVGTQSLNLGVVAFNSSAVGVNTSYHSNFSAQQAGTEMYLEGCVSFGSTYGIIPTTGTTMHLKNTLYDTKTGGGVLNIIS